ncbi:hypothetical protein TWF679_005640 [Orbilia oligospora]|uniref:Uncharacterized protein n=1 Tax=Orbilia oligospora TaxID=2813651 RepID=A0A8H8VBH6_ORBOL|nr:hypothetical protein TWF679_005640 [Orbilia oligospora]
MHKRVLEREELLGMTANCLAILARGKLKLKMSEEKNCWRRGGGSGSGSDQPRRDFQFQSNKQTRENGN